MNILITGAKGQLGTDITNALKDEKDINLLLVDIQELDITDEAKVKKYFDENNIDMVIHTAAWTRVDDAETNKELVYKVNVLGTKYLVNNCEEKNIAMIYFSTDYVFGGEGNEPYKVDDKKNPLGYYAETKYEGEIEVMRLKKYFILRISWVFGKNGNNFIKTMLKLSENHDTLTVVNDQVGSPTYTVDVANIIKEFVRSDKYGVYHVTNEGYVSWADFAREIFKEANKNVKVIDVTTEEYNAKAKRPKNSRLDKSKLVENGFHLLPTWQDALKRYLRSL